MGERYEINYLHDVWCNWFDGSYKGFQIPVYHEWREGDSLQRYQQIPVIKVTEDFFDFVLNDCGTLPYEIIELTQCRARTKDGYMTREVEYAVFIITDGERVLAVNTEGESFPSLKSYIAPRLERYVVEMKAKREPLELQWEDVEVEAEADEDEDEDDSLSNKILHLTEENVHGLTRAEREMKEIIMDCLFNIYCSDNKQEVFYWYIELFPEMYSNEEVRKTDSIDLVAHMYDFLSSGWSERHEEFGRALVRYFDIFEDVWEELEAEKVRKPLTKKK